MTLTQKRLKEILHYNPETGVFTCKVNRGGRGGKAKKGEIAGSMDKDGYLRIMIDRKRYYAQILSFLYMEAYFPEFDVDHINRIRNDNRWKNLRHVSRQCNRRNSSKPKDNTSGVVGVCFDKCANKFKSQIAVNYKQIYLGLFKNFDDAVKARYKKEQELNWGSCDDNSTAYQYLKKHGLLNGKHTQLTIFDFIEKQK